MVRCDLCFVEVEEKKVNSVVVHRSDGAEYRALVCLECAVDVVKTLNMKGLKNGGQQSN